MSLRITILGCGTSSGVPRLDNDWGACNVDQPKNRRLRASILVQSPETTIIVDTGPDMREQLLRSGVHAIDAVIWTHDHADHSHGIDDLRQVAHVLGHPVAGYGHPATLASLRERFAYAFDGRAEYVPIITAHSMCDTTRIGDILIEQVAQPHGTISSSGLIFRHGGKSVVYAIDCHEFTDEMIGAYHGCDLMVIDALRHRHHPTHMSLDQTLEAISRTAPKHAVLSHMDNSMDYDSLCDTLPHGVEPGYDFMVISL